MKSISRRNFLKGSGILAVGAGFSMGVPWISQTTQAQTQSSTLGVSGFARYQLGAMNLTIIPDGHVPFEAELFGVNAPENAVADLLAANNLSAPVNTVFNVMLIEVDDRKVLIDTGFGDFVLPGTDGNVGKLQATLNMLSIDAADITDVVITHFHPDHIGGITLDNTIAFPNAQHYFPQSEWDFLQGDAPVEALTPFFEVANAKLQPLTDNDQVQFYGDEDELVSGIQALAAPGHTPGHHVVRLESEGQALLHLVDTANHYLVLFEHPEWLFGFDTLPEETVATRRELLGRAADENLMVMGYHMPFPGVGHVVRSGDAFRYLPNTL